MRLVYCHACGAVSTNVLGENDICTRCGRSAERVDFHRPWQTYVSAALLLGATAVFVLGLVPDLAVRLVVLVVVVVAAYAISAWGLRVTQERVRRAIESRQAAEEHT